MSNEGGHQGGVRDAPAHHIKSWTDHNPPSTEQVDQSCRHTLALILHLKSSTVSVRTLIKARI